MDQNLRGYKSGIKLLFFILLGFGKIHLNTVELASWVVQVHGFVTVCLKESKKF